MGLCRPYLNFFGPYKPSIAGRGTNAKKMETKTEIMMIWPNCTNSVMLQNSRQITDKNVVHAACETDTPMIVSAWVTKAERPSGSLRVRVNIIGHARNNM